MIHLHNFQRPMALDDILKKALITVIERNKHSNLIFKVYRDRSIWYAHYVEEFDNGTAKQTYHSLEQNAATYDERYSQHSIEIYDFSEVLFE